MDKPDGKTAPSPSPREAKLAEALRANLRRRKASPAPSDPRPDAAPSKLQDPD